MCLNSNGFLYLSGTSGVTVSGTIFSVSSGQISLAASTVEFPSTSALGISIGSKSLANIMWPIGAIFISAVSTNPKSLLGFGTWTQFGQGRVLVGYNASDSDFDSLLGTGGAKTVALTASQIPSHQHSISAYEINYTGPSTGGTINAITYKAGKSSWSKTSFTSTATGSGASHNNLQPYIVVYMWRRTA